MNKILIDLPEILESERLILQAPKAGYGLNLHKAILDGYEDFVKWLNWPTEAPNINEVEMDCRKHYAEFILREFVRYLIIKKDSKEVIGRCAFPSFQANWQIPQFGISYFIAKSYQSKGYATEATYLMAKLAFQIFKAKKVEIFCDSENIASQMIAKKLGFYLEYTTKGGWPRGDGQLADLQCYVIFSEKDLTNF